MSDQADDNDLFSRFQKVCSEISAALPEDGWSIAIEIENGYAGVTLIDPFGDDLHMGESGEKLDEQLEEAIKRAKSNEPLREP